VEQQLAQFWAAFDADRAPMRNSEATPIRPERILAAVERRLQEGAVVVADASYSSSWVVGQLRTSRPDARVITPRGLAGLGWGFPLALGAKLARPDTEVIVVVGDGGFGHAWAEMETAVRSGIAVTVVVLNNEVLGYQKDA
jgi:acetolactate synthase I/II/III large subunit